MVGEPNVDHIVTLLQRCRQKKDLSKAQYVHAYMRDHLLETHSVLGNFLVPVLIDCGSLSDAQILFDKLPTRNEYSWSSLISGYVDSGDPHHAFHLFHKMQEDSVPPNSYTYVALLRACAGLTDAMRGHTIHLEIITKGLERVSFVGNTLIDMYGKCGALAEAQEVFDMLPVRDQVSWTALISVYAEDGFIDASLDCFEQMQLRGISPNISTFVCSMKACTRLKDVEVGRAMHIRIVLRGLERDLFIGNSLVDMYCKCGSLLEARRVFDMLPAQDQVSWTSLISGYAENGLDEEALTCFEQMQQEGIPPNASTFVCSLKSCDGAGAAERGHRLCGEIAKLGLQKHLFVGSAMVGMYAKCGLLGEAQDVFDELTARNAISWTALIAGYAEYQQGEEALSCFQKMQLEGVSPDSFTFSCSVKACAILGASETGQELQIEVVKRGFDRDLSVANTLVDMYGRCGLLAEGRGVFDKMTFRDVVSWTAMIKAYGENHEGDMAVQCFRNMRDQGIKPNTVTFTCLLDACSHASLVLKGQEFFKMMKVQHDIEPTLDHYACMIDLLGRSGRLYEAERLLDAMQCVQSKEEVLTVLLSACKVHGELQLGIKCFQQLMMTNQADAPAFLMMADIYSSAGMWNDSKRMEEMRIHAGAVKKPASASILMNKKLYEFVVGDNHRKDRPVLPETLNWRLRDGGLVPNVDLILIQTCDENEIAEVQENLSLSLKVQSFFSSSDVFLTHESDEENEAQLVSL